MYSNCTVFVVITAIMLLMKEVSTLKQSTTPFSKTIIVGLNPAFQKIIDINNFIVGDVNRVSQLVDGIGGKGQNVVLTSYCLNVKPLPHLAQFLGNGFEGNKVKEFLTNLNYDDSFTLRTDSKCRTCTTIVDNASQLTTEIIEPSGEVNEDEQEMLLSKLSDSFKSEKVEAITFMGSAPPGIDDTYYTQILMQVADKDTKVIVDSIYGIKNIVKASVCEIGCTVCIKVNAQELCKLADVSINNGGSNGIADATVYESCTKLKDIFDIDGKKETNGKLYICCTDGPHNAHMIDVANMHHYKIVIPNISEMVVNPIGAGDSTTTGLMCHWNKQIDASLTETIDGTFSNSDGDTGNKNNYIPGMCVETELLLDSFKFGLACGAASCMNKKNSVLDIPDVAYLYSQMKKIKV